MSKDKKREPNFSSAENELLTTLVREYSHVIENKKTDSTNNQIKEQTWRIIADKFNSSSGLCARDSKTLRAKYENIKKSLKRKYSTYRRSLYATGGGPSQELDLTQEEEVVMELAGQSIEGLAPRTDGDKIRLLQNTEDKLKDVEDVAFVPNSKEKDSLNMDVKDTTQNKVSKFVLKTPKSTPLRTGRNPESFNNTMSSYSNLAKKKSQLLDIQIKSMEEKIKQDQIEHELRCQLLKIEIKIKEKQLEN